MQVSDIKFRCSSLGYIMTNPKSGKGLSETAKTHCIDVWISAKYGRREDKSNKFLEKGNAREEDSITLISRVSKVFFKKNEVELLDEFKKGTPDLFIGESIWKADETFDTKTSWSAHTFFRAQKERVDKMYYWQGVGYMGLTGAKRHTVVYCLVNGTAQAILDEKKRLAYHMGLIDPETSEEYKEKCRQIEINHIFDMAQFYIENPWFEFHNDLQAWKWDIPMKNRVYQQSFERNEEDIQRLHDRITECRKFIETLE